MRGKGSILSTGFHHEINGCRNKKWHLIFFEKSNMNYDCSSLECVWFICINALLASKFDYFAVQYSHKAENQALKRLDLKIMENFGKWSNLEIQKNEVFSTENRFNQFASSIQFL